MLLAAHLLVLMWLLFSSQVFCNKNKTILKEGDILKFPKLAETMQVIADIGAEAFYSGSLGEDLIKDIQEAGLVALTVVPLYTASKSEKCQCDRGKNKLDFSSLWFFKVELWIWRI